MPTKLLSVLAPRWTEVLDSFDELHWIDIMYAFGIALEIENVPSVATHIMDTNANPFLQVTRNLIHYCYRNADWYKQEHQDHNPLFRIPEKLSRVAGDGSVWGILRLKCTKPGNGSLREGSWATSPDAYLAATLDEVSSKLCDFLYSCRFNGPRWFSSGSSSFSSSP
jgi:hypothetical protein